MATQANPWDAFPAAGQGAPQPIIPRRPPPQTAPQAEVDVQQARRAPLQVEREGVGLARDRVALERDERELAAGPAAAAAEAERKAAAFFIRALGSNRDYEATGVGPRSYVGQTLADNAPNLLNQLPASIGNSPQRQVADSTENEFIAATLRQDSGAAIPEEELERQRRIYFPMPGDGPEAIAQKRIARRRALEGLINSAGRALRPEDRAAYEAWIASFDREDGTQPPDTGGTATPGGGSVAFLDEATPPQPTPSGGADSFRTALGSAINSGRYRSAEQIMQFARQINPALAERINQADLQAAMAWRRRHPNDQRQVGVGQFLDAPPEAADSPVITGARGGQPAGRFSVGLFGQPLFSVDTEDVDATVRGAADVATLGLSDEIAAAGDTIFGRGGTFGENLWSQRGVDEYDNQNNPWARAGGQLAGAFAFPTGVGRAAFGGVRGGLREAYAGGAARGSEAARAAGIQGGRRAARNRLGLEGMAYGGTYGTGSGEGDLGDRLTSGGVSAAFGGAGAYGLGRVYQSLFRNRGAGAAGPDTAQLRAARAGEELDVRIPRSVIGGESTQRWATTIEKTPFGAGPMARGTETMINDSQAARDRIAREAGEIMEPDAIGDTAIRGGEAMRSRTSRAAEGLYDEAERLTGETRVPLPGAAAELDGQIAELADTPGVVPEMLSTLQGVRSRLDGDWTPASIRRMRTQLEGQFGSAGMRPRDASRRARIITEAAENDMIGGLEAAGQSDAAQAWRRASDNWRERQSTLRRVIEPILGRDNERTAEDVAGALLRNSRGNGTRLGAFLREIPSEEAGAIRASIINQLGRSPPGQQNAAGEAFSLDTFLTHWDQIRGARHQIFPRGTVAGLNRLAEIAEQARFAGRARNQSSTGTPMMATATAGPLIGGATALLMGSPKVAVAGAVLSAFSALAQNRAGALLASPRLAQRLANTPLTPAGATRYWSGPWVSRLARAEPAIASDLFGLQQMTLRNLSGAARSPATRAAAQEDENVRSE